MSVRNRLLMMCGLALTVAGAVGFFFYARIVQRANELDHLNVARAFAEQIVQTRYWLAEHSGVYVRKRPGVETNPFLQGIPGVRPDIVDSSGNTYTLRNPAAVTRELSQLAARSTGYRFRVTSLRPLNPANAPDPFEEQALRQFEAGQNEAWHRERTDGGEVYRYVLALRTEQGCLHCHAAQGYRVGDVRGGLSLTMPAHAAIGPSLQTIALSWLAGVSACLLALFLAMRRSVIEPIEALKRASARIAGGDYEEPVPWRTDDELGDLARSMDTMRERIRAATTHLEETVRTRTAELEQRTADLDAFAHMVAHDLKSPLSGVTGLARLLEVQHGTRLGEDGRALAQAISASGRKMRDIIDELLLLASLRKDQVKLVPLDMQAIVESTLERLAPSLRESGAEVQRPESWPAALGHGQWVEEVWCNYLSNAVKYGGRPPRIALGGSRVTEGQVRFWVADNGPGLTQEEQRTAFEPFTRFGRRSEEGQGLGLSIVANIVDKLGGEVAVSSDPSEGTVFSFTLPAAEPSSPQPSLAPQPSAPDSAQPT